VVDRRNYFTFTPFLPEVAVGAPRVSYPFRVRAKRVAFAAFRAERRAGVPESGEDVAAVGR